MDEVNNNVICKGDSECKSPLLKYEENFEADSSYKSTLPDIQNSSRDNIRGANVPIMQVGMHNFKLPLRFFTNSGDIRELEASITSTVYLAANCKGINMSRIMRVFYEFENEIFTIDTLEKVLKRLKDVLESSKPRLKISFEYPIRKTSLRSNHSAWQYYNCAYEGFLDENDNFKKVIYFDFVYSSACPCSFALSEHARNTRNVYCVPHSQRSKARIVAQIKQGENISIEDMQKICLVALKTETQTMVRREDEQAFAELNGAYTKFIEDATRLLYQEFNDEQRISDFEIACIHLESLHSHDAVGVICKGIENGFDASFSNFKDLIC